MKNTNQFEGQLAFPAGGSSTGKARTTPATHQSSLSRCRELLGEEAVGMTDEEVAAVGRHADMMARIIVASYLEQLSKRAA